MINIYLKSIAFLVIFVVCGCGDVSQSNKDSFISDKPGAIHIYHDMVRQVHKEDRCTMVVKAMPVPISKKYSKYEYVGNVPNILNISMDAWPVMIPNSCSKAGICMWVVSLKDNCNMISRSAYFVKFTDERMSREQFVSGIGGPDELDMQDIGTR